MHPGLRVSRLRASPPRRRVPCPSPRLFPARRRRSRGRRPPPRLPRRSAIRPPATAAPRPVTIAAPAPNVERVPERPARHEVDESVGPRRRAGPVAPRHGRLRVGPGERGDAARDAQGLAAAVAFELALLRLEARREARRQRAAPVARDAPALRVEVRRDLVAAARLVHGTYPGLSRGVAATRPRTIQLVAAAAPVPGLFSRGVAATRPRTIQVLAAASPRLRSSLRGARRRRRRSAPRAGPRQGSAHARRPGSAAHSRSRRLRDRSAYDRSATRPRVARALFADVPRGAGRRSESTSARQTALATNKARSGSAAAILLTRTRIAPNLRKDDAKRTTRRGTLRRPSS